MLDFKIEVKGFQQALKNLQDEMEAAIRKEYQSSLKKMLVQFVMKFTRKDQKM